VNQIRELMPEKFDTYYEPFLGTGIVLTAAAGKCSRMVGSDISPYLMDLWKYVRDNPAKILEHYSAYWPANAEKYYECRDRFNTTYDPLDFYNLVRTSINGLVRFNMKTNKFNASFHHCGRVGMEPASVEALLNEWHQFIHEYNVSFEEKSFEWILDVVTKDDFVFMDPPYKNSGGMYGNAASIESLEHVMNELNKIGCRWMMTFDGIIEGRDTSHAFNPALYKTHDFFKVAISKWVVDKSRKVAESYYLNY
jgi:DNA adenine methylase